MIFTDEVKNMEELLPYISEYKSLGKVKVAVICFLFDKSGDLILQRRGPGARDEVGMLEAIGGSVNGSDEDFRAALERELVEETGKNAKIEIGDFIGAQIDGKTDRNSGEFVNWVILAYKGKLTSGELYNAEPDRCIGFEKNKMDRFPKQEVATTCLNFIKYMLSEK